MSLIEGQEVPDFTRPLAGGGSVTLSDLRGQPVVIFAYPRAGTPTCTREACAFSDGLAPFAARGVQVFGLSPDPVAALERFAARHHLAMPLVSDEGHELLAQWGIWVEKQMYGRRYMGVERTTVLIDAQGRAAQVWRKVRVGGHVEAVLKAVDAL
ncbi:MAG: peroxiredoxin [Rubellimicrobium sp.]|nr:peroxiredoxin [Rubellimicrobium sp.]